MKRHVLGLLLGLGLASGCATRPYNTMVTTRYNSATGQKETIYYTGLYEALETLVATPRGIGLHLIIQMDREQKDGIYRTKARLGALGPDDLSAPGIFFGFLVNLSETDPMTITLSSIQHMGSPDAYGQHGNTELLSTPIEANLQPRDVRRLDFGTSTIFTYGTNEIVQVAYTFQGIEELKTISVERLTFLEAERRYGHQEDSQQTDGEATSETAPVPDAASEASHP